MTTLSALQEQETDGARPAGGLALCVLLIEPRPATATALRSGISATSAASCNVLRTATIASGVDALTLGGVDVVVVGTEVRLDAAAVAPLVQAARGIVPIIALQPVEEPEAAARLIALGIHDCVSAADAATDTLAWTLARAVQRTRARPTAPDGVVSRTATVAPAVVLSPQAIALVTPAVGALVGLLELLTTAWDVLEDDQKLSLLATVRSCAASVERLANEVGAADGEPSEPSEPQLVALGVAVRVAARQAPTQDITVDVDPHAAVWIDPGHLQQILASVLTQAAELAAPPLSVTSSTRGSSVRLSVTGTVSAAASDAAEWSLHHPVPSARGADEAVALDVARRLAERSGGIVGVDEQAGCVWLRLPSLPPHPDFS